MHHLFWPKYFKYINHKVFLKYHFKYILRQYFEKYFKYIVQSIFPISAYPRSFTFSSLTAFTDYCPGRFFWATRIVS